MPPRRARGDVKQALTQKRTPGEDLASKIVLQTIVKSGA